MKNVKIVNISENKRFGNPGIFYAELIDIDAPVGYQLLISATLEYIFDALREENKEFNCVNIEKDKYDNFVIKT